MQCSLVFPLCKTHTPAGFQDRRAGREHGSGSSFVARVAVTCTCMRNGGPFCSFYFACVQHLLKLQSLQTYLQSCLQAICFHRVISFVLLCYSRCGRSFILHFCIHFLSPQAAEALQVAAREAREVSIAITCVEPRSPHAQAARMVSRTNRRF